MRYIRREMMAVAAAGLLTLTTGAAVTQAKTVGVSWRHFQEERWKIDEAGIKETLAKAGYDYVGADAQADPQKQLTDIESLIARKVDALIILAQDSAAILPAFEKAKAEGIPTIAYDVPVDFADTLFISFDNVAVGRLMAQAMVAAQPKGDWVLIEGDPMMADRRPVPPGPDGGGAAPGRQGRYQDRGQAGHRELEARRRPVDHGPDPDQGGQQGRCGPGDERRHVGRRRRGARLPGAAGQGGALGAGRRRRGAEPDRQGRGDGDGVEEREETGRDGRCRGGRARFRRGRWPRCRGQSLHHAQRASSRRRSCCSPSPSPATTSTW